MEAGIGGRDREHLRAAIRLAVPFGAVLAEGKRERLAEAPCAPGRSTTHG